MEILISGMLVAEVRRWDGINVSTPQVWLVCFARAVADREHRTMRQSSERIRERLGPETSFISAGN
jgi:hypothetical protein